MRRAKKRRIRQVTAAVTAAMLSLSAPAASVYADSGETEADTQSQVLIEDEETIEIDVNRTYVSGTNGWVQENGHWCYYINGVKQTGDLYTQDGQYLLDGNGYLITGWYRESADSPYFYYDPLKGGARAYGLTTVNGVTYYFYGYMRTDYAVVENGVLYYFGSDGALASKKSGVSNGWLQVGSDWYYVENGVLSSGLKTIGGQTYYFDNGKKITNERRMVLDASSGTNSWYEFDSNGYMVTGWRTDSDGIRYYYNSNGKSAYGMTTVGSSTYYFAADGHMCTDYSVSINGKMYYFGSDGVLTGSQGQPSNGWKQMSDGWYYFKNGSMVKAQFLTLDGVTYYLDENGRRCTTAKWIDGAWYRFDANGSMITGWYSDSDGSWYYYGSNGQAGSGFTQIGGVWYWLEYNGYMATSTWKQTGSTWYYMTAAGNMAVGWCAVDGVWYYFDASGTMATGWRELGGSWYYLTPGGSMAVGWCAVNGVWYYFDGSGAMLTNRWIDGVYYVKSSGAMAKNEWVDNNQYYVNADGVWEP